ncbi:MAG: tRNA pseudouridine(38-40) synthase TruA [Deltaproteobacteria bacterium]|nr:tRNA pseudouridine(38-40) synthase TruA [Deltaproteobacteria bacterium]
MGTRRNLRLLLEYDGARYHGWQRQKNAPSIQAEIEAALHRLTGEDLRLIGSGRTDAGVHARGQVANFHTGSTLPLTAFVHGLNSLLPPDIAVLEALEAPPSFHARKSALGKTYAYHILNRPVPSPLERRRAWWIAQPLDLAAMREAAAALPGEHDFSAFRAAGGSAVNPVRRVLEASWTNPGEGRLLFNITATGFLRGMVRSLVGAMVEVGRGKRPPAHLAELLTTGHRPAAGPTAPPQGLVLVEVIYT